MNDSVLLTYATCAGSTAEVAEAIKRILLDHGVSVHLRPMQDITNLTDYRAVILGSAIQAQQWLPEAMAFLQTHRAALNQKPTAIFSLCLTLAMKNGEKYRPDIMEWLAPVRSITQPASEGLFAGVLDISQVPSFGERLKFRLSVLFGVWTEGDHRDWDSIRQWTASLPQKLGLET